VVGQIRERFAYVKIVVRDPKPGSRMAGSLRIIAKTFSKTDGKTSTMANLGRAPSRKMRFTRGDRRSEDNPIAIKIEAAELASEWRKVIALALVASADLLVLPLRFMAALLERLIQDREPHEIARNVT
jgi:hypothetical protein